MNVFYWNWEFDWLYALQKIHNLVLDRVMAVLSDMGNAGIFWILLAVVLMIIRRTRPAGCQMMLSIIITFVIGNLILKNAIMRARPCQIDETVAMLVAAPSDYSFPSGHSMNGFTAATALFYNNKKLGIPALVLATLIAFSRLYNFVHFPTDVFFGIVLGTVVALAVCSVWNRTAKSNSL